MYIGLKHTHSGLAYILLAGLVIAIALVIVSATAKKPFTDRVRKFALIGLILSHLQLVIGLILYFVSPAGLSSLSGEAMKDATLRFNTVEHPLTMIIAIILVTIGYSRSKRAQSDSSKYRSVIIFYLLGLFLMLLRIPWSIWP